MSADRQLAALVEKHEADEAIGELKREGCYDRDRHIREVDETALAIPVTDPPTTTAVAGLVRQDDPPWRSRDLEDYLRDRGVDENSIENAPRGWAVIGDVILTDTTDCENEATIARALLDLHGSAHTVLTREGITGDLREPSVRVIGGRGETETVHAEHGTEYALDLQKVMFSPGNKAERARMGKVVRPGETVLDMFAGIGYFALPMARAGARVTAIERNPAAFAYLLENVDRNGVTDRVSPIRGDCDAVVPLLASQGPVADRIVMGHFDAASSLSVAKAALRPGGTIHLHTLGPTDAPFEVVEGKLSDVHVSGRHIVKTHGPGTVHGVLDLIGGAN